MTHAQLPQVRPDAEIILCVSAKAGLVAIPVGEKYPYGHTVLRATRAFDRQKEGSYILRDLSAMPDVMPALIQTAKLHRVTLTTSPRPYLGDFARELVDRLPGAWTTKFEVYAHPVWQEDWMPLLWDSGELAEAMEHCRVPYGTVLTSATGAELLLIEQPGGAGRYLLGACASSTFDDNYRNPYAPSAITLPAYAQLAADQVTSTFLPRYERAVHERLLAEVERGHEHLVELRHAADPSTETATAVLRRLRPHAAHLLDRTCRAVAPGPTEGEALDRLATLLNPARTSPARPSSVLRVPAPLPPASAADVHRWLADAPVLLKHARAALPPGPGTGARKALLPTPLAIAATPPHSRSR
ncbi:hypothetical protein ACWGI1_00180 [Streptomyces sp. NPDC054835]